MKLRQTSFGGGLVLNYSAQDMLIGGEVATYGTYENFEMHILLQTLNKGDTAIDVGGNIGVYTLPMAKKVGQKGKIYTFEPDPTNFFILSKNIIDNKFLNVLPISLGLADHKQEGSLYLSLDNMGDHRVYDAHYRRKRKSIPITLDTLDRVLNSFHENNRVTTLKIDTQGYEPFVIKGAMQTIINSHPTIFLEYWPFGYKKAHADDEWMMYFLEQEYTDRYFIDVEQEKLTPLSKAILDNYFYPLERAESHCNLVFKS